MDMKLRTALMNIQTNYQEATTQLRTVAGKYKALGVLGRQVYKQVITAQPALANNPLWVNFRVALGIPEGAVDPETSDEPSDDSKADATAVEAVGAMNKITALNGMSPEKRAAVLDALETAIENARVHLNLPA